MKPVMTVYLKEDGCWVEFKTANGGSFALNITEYAKTHKGPVTQKVITQWINEQFPGAIKPEPVKGQDGLTFPHTVDAAVWIDEWRRTIKDHPGIPDDSGTMLGWFANAIVAGMDKGRKDSDAYHKDALDYARRLATNIYLRHYKNTSTHWQVSDTITGVLSQIDNMVANMARKQMV